MSAFARSRRLTIGCCRLLLGQRSLLAFPLLAAVLLPLEVIGFVAAVVAVIAVTGHAHDLRQILVVLDDTKEHASAAQRWLGFGLLALLFFVLQATVAFIDGAFTACVLARLEGGRPTLGDGLRAAWRRRWRLLAWAGVSTAFQIGLDRLRRALPGIAGPIAAIVGTAAWSFATFLVVPVLMAEDGGVRAAIARSGALLRATWGDQVRLRLGFSLMFSTLSIAGLVGMLATILVPLALAHPAHESTWPAWLIATACLAMVAWLALLCIVFQCLRQILLGAMYAYAVTGMLPDEIAPDLLPAAKP